MWYDGYTGIREMGQQRHQKQRHKITDMTEAEEHDDEEKTQGYPMAPSEYQLRLQNMDDQDSPLHDALPIFGDIPSHKSPPPTTPPRTHRFPGTSTLERRMSFVAVS